MTPLVTGGAWIVCILASAAPAAGPQAASSAGAIFQPARLTAGTDSFRLVMRGQTRGYLRSVRTIDRGRTRIVSDFDAPGIEYRLHREVVFDATTLMPVSHAARESYRGIVSTSQVSVAAARATGTAQEGGATGVRSILVDAVLPQGTVDGKEISSLLVTLDLADGFKASVSSFDLFPGEARSTEVTVTGKETVTVPAGKFETYRVLLKPPGSPQVLIFVTTTAPRRVVLIRDSNSELQLVK